MAEKEMVGRWDNWSDAGLRARIMELRMERASIEDELLRRGKVKYARYTRIERFEQIKRVLSDGLVHTTSQIAKELGMSASGHLRAILCELYRDGSILGYAENTVARHPVYYWYTQSTIPLPSPDFQRIEVCDSVTEDVDFPF